VSRIRRLAFVSNAQISGNRGGAEAFNERMVEHLSRYVGTVDHIEVPVSETNMDEILRAYLACYDLDLSGYDGVISTKAPTYAVRHPNHICYLVHTMRVFYDMFDEISAHPGMDGARRLIHRLDSELLRPPRTKGLFSIGGEVNKRLERYNGLTSTVLHPGLPAGRYYGGSFEYLFMPGRLHKWKRVGLMIEAMRHIKSPVRLKIAGTGDELPALKRQAEGDPRIEFLGFVSDDEMKALYAGALCVVFLPVREDYGLILHEGFASGKPVITCVDSGEPVRFIRQGENGFAVEPDPRRIAEKAELLYGDRALAEKMGKAGAASIAHINWDSIVKVLIGALEG
jgi:glycosyltransferase involved in cell wall biosynthesis